MLVRGPEDGPQVVLLPPLFEEMNFTRALLAELGRCLARQGVGSWLPDLPGTGESRHPLPELGWQDWLDAARAIGDAVAARAGGNPLVCAFRGGALLDHALGARARWRYAPADGAALLRHLVRAQRIADRESGTDTPASATVMDLAGYGLSAPMRAGLEGAKPTPDPDREFAAAAGALWRRAEPGRDDALAHLLASDICDWIETCVAR